MPLPNITNLCAKKCTAKSKRTGLPCNNLAAYECKTCRMHGARKSETIKRGKLHPNYLHGRRTLEAELEQSATSCRLQQLEDALFYLKLINGKQTKGRKAKAWQPINSCEQIKKIK